jgi:hypothetical protein
MSDIQKVLAPGEKILWEGKPQFWPFIFSALPILLIAAIFIFVSVATNGGDGFAVDFSDGAFTTLILAALVGPGYFLYQLIVYRFVYYVITDKRTLIQAGVIGRDFTGIEHDAVVSTSVYVGLTDRVFGKNSGTVKILHSGSASSKRGTPQPTGLVSVTDPYAVYQLFNKTSHDVRTDIQYPNAMRPENNPGYKTEYNK